MATSLQNFVAEKCFRNLVFSAILINRFNCFRIKYCFALYGLILLGPSWKLVSKYQIIQSISERLPIAFKFENITKYVTQVFFTWHLNLVVEELQGHVCMTMFSSPCLVPNIQTK